MKHGDGINFSWALLVFVYDFNLKKQRDTKFIQLYFKVNQSLANVRRKRRLIFCQPTCVSPIFGIPVTYSSIVSTGRSPPPNPKRRLSDHFSSLGIM